MLALRPRCLRRSGSAYAQALRPLDPVQSRRRHLLTLAIETSCDDTSVAILQKRDHDRSTTARPFTSPSTCTLHFHEKITANNSAHGGVHPITSLESHQENLAVLLSKALKALPESRSPNEQTYPRSSDTLTLHRPGRPSQSKQKPDFISVTRGPGMRSSLTTGLDTAKGLAVAWQVPLVGVNHMQAHALTPRLVSALNDSPINGEEPVPDPTPAFPFLSLLVSGGHTLLLHSTSLTSHALLATTTDLAIGDFIDKVARLILPRTLLAQSKEIMYGRLLEAFVFPLPSSGRESVEYNYIAPTKRAEEIARKPSKWGWALGPPLAETRSGSKSRAMEFTFSGLGSAVRRVCEGKVGGEMGEEERRELAREAMRLAFEHLASRVGWALRDLEDRGLGVMTLVVSGGVASNGFLRTVLRFFLTARGFSHIRLTFPPISLCTDNAAMIAWTGMEMYESGWESDLKCRALKKWSLDANAEDGGVLGDGCWKRRDV